MNKARLICGAGLVTGLLLALTASAHAASVEGPYPLGNPTKFTVQGERSGGARSDGSSCEIPQPTLTLAPRERAVAVRQLSVNPRTCRATFEKGTPPPGAERLHASSKPQSADSESGGERGVSASGTSYRYGATGRAYYYDDRTDKIVTEVNSGADWNSSGGCISTNNIFFANYASTHTGWREVSHRWSYVDDECRYLVSSTNARFRDRNFSGCSDGPQVETFFNRVRIVGYANGELRGSRESRVEPTCKNVLVAYFALFRRGAR